MIVLDLVILVVAIGFMFALAEAVSNRKGIKRREYAEVMAENIRLHRLLADVRETAWDFRGAGSDVVSDMVLSKIAEFHNNRLKEIK